MNCANTFLKDNLLKPIDFFVDKTPGDMVKNAI